MACLDIKLNHTTLVAAKPPEPPSCQIRDGDVDVFRRNPERPENAGQAVPNPSCRAWLLHCRHGAVPTNTSSSHVIATGLSHLLIALVSFFTAPLLFFINNFRTMSASSSAIECSMASPTPRGEILELRHEQTTTPPPDESDSLLMRIFLTPLLFISFLLSLLLIDNRNHNTVVARQRSSSPTSSAASVLGRVFGLRWSRRGGKEENQTWFWKAKQRKMARMEFSEAFEVRKRVLMGIVCGGMLGCLVGLWAVRWTLRSAIGWLKGS